MEAQRVISVSLGKIAQSRVQRTGCSLHKSLMVASILQKARHVYVEQAFMMHCRPAAPVPAPVAPPAPAAEAPTYTDLDACSPAERGASGAPSDAAEPSEPARRKRLISDEETEEAVASILPKRARTEDLAEDLATDVSADLSESLAAEVSADLTAEESSPESKESESSKDIDSDDSDDSCYESGDSDDNETDAMDIDRITSLVSVFSFDGMKMRAAPEPCSREWECSSDPVPVRA